LDADLFIGLPEDLEGRVAPALLPDRGAERSKLADKGPYAARVVNWISPRLTPADINRRDIRCAELPSGNGISNARSLARVSLPRLDPSMAFDVCRSAA